MFISEAGGGGKMEVILKVEVVTDTPEDGEAEAEEVPMVVMVVAALAERRPA